MRTTLDCLPCLARLALRTARQVSDDPQLHERVLRSATRALSDADWHAAPPLVARPLFELIRRAVGDDDPLRGVRDHDNRLAEMLAVPLRERIARSADPVGTALRLSAAGNAIDFAACGATGPEQLERAIEQALAAPFDREVATFHRALDAARDVLLLADNAGELVFDRLLVEVLPVERITVAVRGGPCLNDALLSDAAAVGLPGICEVIDNGSNVPGTVLEDCSDSFVERFEAASLIIAKGQGNYETLSGVPANLVFLLKVKCAVVADQLGCPEGAIVLRWMGADRPAQ